MIIFKVRTALRPPCAQYPALTPPDRHRSAGILRDRPFHVCVLLTRPQDIITGDEILSDSYDVKEIDGIAYEADCSRITVGVDNVGASQSLNYPSNIERL